MGAMSRHAKRIVTGALTATLSIGSLGLATAVVSHVSAASSAVVPGRRPSTAAAAVSAAPSALGPFTTQTGKIYMSVDAFGSNDPAGGPIKVHKNNAGVTVQSAFLMAASTGFSGYTPVNGDVTLNGTPIAWDPTKTITNSISSVNVLADVTSIVKPIVAAAAPGDVALTVIEPNNAPLTRRRGSCRDPQRSFAAERQHREPVVRSTLHDRRHVRDRLGEPDQQGDANLKVDDEPGDLVRLPAEPSGGPVQSDRCQLQPSHDVGRRPGRLELQVRRFAQLLSLRQRLVDHRRWDRRQHGEPADPNATDLTCTGAPRCDDELYNLLPFVNNGDTSIKVDTLNPSNDDNVFFGGFELDSTVACFNGCITLSPASATNPVNTNHTVTAKVQDDLGNPIANKVVTFKVLSGPNAGKTGTGTTNASGTTTFTYTSSVTGTDTIQASFVDANDQTVLSNIATKTWTPTTGASRASVSTVRGSRRARRSRSGRGSCAPRARRVSGRGPGSRSRW